MAAKSARPAWRRFLTARPTVQTAALLLANGYWLSFLRFLPCGYLQCSNCALSSFSCPLILLQRGAVMGGMGLLGMMGAKILGSVAAALAILVFFGALLGTWGCGWLCPFGFLQDLLAKVPTRKFLLPGWSGWLRLPLFLAAVAAVPWLTATLFFCDLCPAGTVNRLWQEAAGIPLFFKTPTGAMAAVSLGLLVITSLAALFVQRPFCSLLCPLGGLHGLFNRVSGLFLQVDRERCTGCGRCRESCPQGLDPAATPNHSQCSRCLECTRTCKFIKLEVRL